MVAAYRYAPFGKLLAKTGSLTQPFGFSTKRYDEQTGLIYYGFRFYEPEISRWLTRDPLGEAGGMNLYAFVGNNPANWVDPWGLRPMGWTDLLRQYGPQRPNYQDNKQGNTHCLVLCEAKCVVEQLGITTVLGISGVTLGQPLLKAPGKVKGATKGTSIASKYLSKWFPQKLPFRVRTPVSLRKPFVKSRVLGRILGRWTPLIGLGFLAYDAVSITRCKIKCLINCHMDPIPCN